MHAQASVRRWARGALVAVWVPVATLACGFGPLPGRATEEWTKTYPLTGGGVRATDLRGPVDASSTNGGVNVDLASVGSDRIALSTTNGGVTLNLPESAKADLVATWTNGGLSVDDGLRVDVSERSRRRFEG